MSDSIFLVETLRQGEYGDTFYEVDPDLGFFLSREDVEKYVAVKNDWERRYEAYTRAVEQNNSTATVRFEAKVKAWNILRDAGVAPEFFKPSKDSFQEVLPFERWLRLQIPEYRWEEVERNEG